MGDRRQSIILHVSGEPPELHLQQTAHLMTTEHSVDANDITENAEDSVLNAYHSFIIDVSYEGKELG